MRHFDRDFIEKTLTYDVCIPAMREAMMRLAAGQTHHIPRAVMKLSPRRLFGVMAGDVGDRDLFGSKIVSVFHENPLSGRPAHQGIVVLFDPETGAPTCTADASAITAIRTAAASAAATDSLAKPDANRLAILGCGEQAVRHAKAIGKIRSIIETRIWGRSATRAEAVAATLSDELNTSVAAYEDVRSAVAGANIICTVTGASDPVLFSDWVAPGAHINAVGSSLPSSAEIDSQLVAETVFVADCAENVRVAGGEFIRARASGLIEGDKAILEIGDVYSGKSQGRNSQQDVTVYKSLGHIVQDLGAVQCLINLSAA